MNHVVLAEILGPDMLVVIAIIALLFGGGQVPKLARSLGQAKKEFEKGGAASDEDAAPEAEKPAPGSEMVTMSKAELDAFLAEREQAARRQAAAEADGEATKTLPPPP